MEYKWTISALDCKVNEDGLTNVITTIHWRYSATDEDGITSEIYGAQLMSSPNPESFTPYEEVDLNVISNWLESKMNMEKIQEDLINQIELIKNPIIVTLPLYQNPSL
jgi:hypothetical protein